MTTEAPPAPAPSRLRATRERYGAMAGDVVWSGLADLVVLVANLASFKLLGDELSPVGWGAYIGFLAVIGPLGSLSWAGLTLFVLQRIIREDDDPGRVARMAFTLLAGQGVVGIAVALGIAALIIDGIAGIALVVLAVVELIVVPLVMITVSLRQAVVGFPAAARLRMSLVALRTVVLVTLFTLGSLTLTNLALAWLASLSLLALWCLRVLLPRIGITPGFAKPTRSQAGGVASLSVPMASANVQTDGDKAVLNAFDLQRDAGLYGVAFRIVLLAQLPIQTMNTALFQRFLSHDENARGQHVRRTVKFTVVSTVLSTSIGAAMYVAAPLVTVLLDGYDESVPMVRALLLFLPLVAVSHAPLNALLGLGAARLRAWILVGSAALSMVLYLALIPSLSWKGALIGTVAAELVLLVSGWTALIVLQRRFDADLDARADRTPPEPGLDPDQAGVEPEAVPTLASRLSATPSHSRS